MIVRVPITNTFKAKEKKYIGMIKMIKQQKRYRANRVVNKNKIMTFDPGVSIKYHMNTGRESRKYVNH